MICLASKPPFIISSHQLASHSLSSNRFSSHHFLFQRSINSSHPHFCSISTAIAASFIAKSSLTTKINHNVRLPFRKRSLPLQAQPNRTPHRSRTLWYQRLVPPVPNGPKENLVLHSHDSWSLRCVL